MCLNEPLLMPETEITDGVMKAKESVESRNIQLAIDLEAGKTKLINALSQFPGAALWLLHKYETSVCESELSSEALTPALARIKSCFLQASLAFSGKRCNRGAETNEKRSLTEALQGFSFSVDDLLVLPELMIYVFMTREGYSQHDGQNVTSLPDWIAKRMKGSNRRGRLNLPDIMEAMHAGQFDEQFLFLSRADMQQYMQDMILAERLWLSTRQALAEANSGLVLFIANRYKSSFLDFDDLVQEGQSGLLKAIDKFDHRLGYQFSTYAAYWVRQAISRALSRGERVVRVPCEQVANINRVLRAKSELLAKTGREPSIKELAEHSKIPEDQINAILCTSQTAVSLENLDDDEDSLAPIDFLEQQVFAHPFNKIEQADLKDWIGNAIKVLDPRELKVICCHFGVNTDNEMTLQEIGAELNLTRERVRQIQVKALNKMKLSYGNQLMSFL